jgi:type IV secretory pathway TrbF-like protein
MRLWQAAALGFGVLALVALGSLSYLATHPPAQEWVVLHVTPSGEIQRTTYLPEHWTKPSPLMIERTLQQWVEHFRWVPSDGFVHTKHFQEAAALLTPAGKALATPMATERFKLREDGFKVAVTFRSILPEDSTLLRWQVEWWEQTVDKFGTQKGPDVLWKGIFVLEILDLETLKATGKPRSSLGIFIQDFSILKLAGTL